MAYDESLAELMRNALAESGVPGVVEKKMFGGLAFLVRGKMCINVGRRGLMLRYDPAMHDEVSKRHDYQHKVMRGREMKSYCTVDPVDFRTEEDFYYWLNLCLAYNEKLVGGGM